MDHDEYLRKVAQSPEAKQAVLQAVWAGCRNPNYASIRESLRQSLHVAPAPTLVGACGEVAHAALYGMLYDAQLSQGLSGTKFDFLLRNP